jgi:hypothetical protein
MGKVAMSSGAPGSSGLSVQDPIVLRRLLSGIEVAMARYFHRSVGNDDRRTVGGRSVRVALGNQRSHPAVPLASRLCYLDFATKRIEAQEPIQTVELLIGGEIEDIGVGADDEVAEAEHFAVGGEEDGAVGGFAGHQFGLDQGQGAGGGGGFQPDRPHG